MKITNTRITNEPKTWAEEHSNDFSDYDMIDNIIDNDIDFIDCADENGTIIIFC